jgi:sulfoxide reductase heme-binding subunit YedZ
VHGVLTFPPVWYLMRASGIVSLLLLTLVVALGVATSRRLRLAGRPRGVTAGLHRNASLLAVVFLSVHVLTAVVDPDAAVGVVALLLPFADSARALWVGLGALSLELVAALVVTSLVRRRLSRRAWRSVHWLAYAAWPLALLHGVGMGSDTATTWMTAVNLACVAAVGIATTYRLAAVDEATA